MIDVKKLNDLKHMEIIKSFNVHVLQVYVIYSETKIQMTKLKKKLLLGPEHLQ